MTTTTTVPRQLLTVGQVSETYGVTVRTLHHYDQVGILRPSERSTAGYRLYTEDDLERLQHVVVYRRLGFSLGEVARLLADVDAQGSEAAVAHLRRQREVVRTRLAEMRDLVRAIDRAMERAMNDTPATPRDLQEIFGQAWDEHEGYQAEAEQRWGDTPQWAQAQGRQAGMTKADWAAVKAESDALERDLAAALAAGEDPGSDAAAALAERHRAAIERHYDCPHAFQVKLAQMYVADERFRSHYDERHPGLAQWLHDAIVANAARQGVVDAGA
ncbi:MerR family transcriptional regulator [Arsenicicoccus dermatophilus]|uniref:MerR family transcriptional regulator n=1 Tax=Arsenicicoccus dermatophilus TaxID=1076331 RepID=UPI003916DD9B